jgi:imidazole glycerol-phosphate synthase subunit HisH
MSAVVIVDYGIGNIKSVQRGLERIGSTAVLSFDPDEIINADRVILPGVGAFEDGMMGLKQLGLDDAIYQFCSKGNPLLGICLGMQMLLQQSEEFGIHKGLSLIDGTVNKIPQTESGSFKRKTPHIGWSALKRPRQQDWNNSCLEDIKEDEFFYFVHSFMAVPTNPENRLAHCIYEGLSVTAAIRKENIIGVQFHPEKSGEAGLKILKRFVTI